MQNLNEKTDLSKLRICDVKEPVLYRDIFSYEEVPKCSFDTYAPSISLPKNIWITDTTFRDGQQSRTPYTVEQIVQLFKMLSRLGGEKGIIRQTEFFMYSEIDREAIRNCQSLGLPFPEITGWIRATKSDLDLVKNMNLKECGVLTSCSDYHIFSKLKMTRKEAFDSYINVIESMLDCGIRPRCHLEDVTRADYYGFVIPFINELCVLMDKYKMPIKIRLADTMGYGVPYPNATLPRSVPYIIQGINKRVGFDSELIEWHGHNDFYKSVSNATTAWLYGASAVNCTLLGIGERTGNTPLEAMVFEYAQLKGTLDGMDTKVITEIAKYYENEIGYDIPSRTPFVGRDFNVTRAGVHVDGIAKDEEIYNIFDTDKILNRPVGVEINKNSGSAGIAYWLNHYLDITDDNHKILKTSQEVAKLLDWVNLEYANGRVTFISRDELVTAVKRLTPDLYELKCKI